MIEYEKVKLVIWDLDDTFWKGTLSEGPIDPILANIELVKKMAFCGVISSICSKNDESKTDEQLRNLNVRDYFVFPSVDWTSKGPRIVQMIKTMGLRAENVLYLDDNIQNLNEAKHYSEKLMIGLPAEEIAKLISFFEKIPESDQQLKRLNQYKILEKKEREKSNFNSNKEFLYSCNLQVEVHENCLEQIDRIAELVHRSNQLNYTKLRSTKDELITLVSDERNKCGWVSVKDKFGDYGLVGFYVIEKSKNECIHLLFSCRTIGQGVEQWVYAYLGYPKLLVVEPVISKLTSDKAPLWINQKKRVLNEQSRQTKDLNVKLLFKGPCDLLGLINYIEGKCQIDHEFTYIGKKNNLIESQNHSVSLDGLYQYTDDQKKLLIDECSFLDLDFWKSNLFTETYDMVFLSSLMEPNLGIYRKKNTNLYIPFGEVAYPITNKANWKGLIDSTIYNAQNDFSENYLRWFSENYEFVGSSTPETYIQRLSKIVNRLNPKTKVCIVLGSETECLVETLPGYEGRHLQHRKFNVAIREFAKKNPRIELLDVNKFIKSQADFGGKNINHFSVNIYFELAQEVIRIVERNCSCSIRSSSKLKMVKIACQNNVKAFLKSLFPHNGKTFKLIRSFFRGRK